MAPRTRITRTRAETARATEAYDALVADDPVLRAMEREHGRPDPFSWTGGAPAGVSNFAALVLHITSQQISTTVALTMFARIQALAGPDLDPRRVRELGPDDLRGAGLSTAKTRAVLELAEREVSGDLDLDGLEEVGDDAAVATLVRYRGVGQWTAEMFLIHQLRRPDVLPAGDLGIRHAVQAGWGLPSTPGIEEVRALGEGWSPYRTYAAALLWSSLRTTTPASQQLTTNRTDG